jgi:hypothetical protein
MPGCAEGSCKRRFQRAQHAAPLRSNTTSLLESGKRIAGQGLQRSEDAPQPRRVVVYVFQADHLPSFTVLAVARRQSRLNGADGYWQRRRGNLLPSYQGAGNSPLPRLRFPRCCIRASACSQCIREPRKGPPAAEMRSRKRSELPQVRDPARRASTGTQCRDFCAAAVARLPATEHEPRTIRPDAAAEDSV